MHPGLAALEHPPEFDTKLHIVLIPVTFALVGANTYTSSYLSTTSVSLPFTWEVFLLAALPCGVLGGGHDLTEPRQHWKLHMDLDRHSSVQRRFSGRSSSAVSRCVPFAPPPHSGSCRRLFFDPLGPTAVKDFDGWILAGLQDGVSAPCSAFVDQVDYHPHRQAPRGPLLHGTTTPFFILVLCTITTRTVDRTTMKRAAQMILGDSLRFHLVPMIS